MTQCRPSDQTGKDSALPQQSRCYCYL